MQFDWTTFALEVVNFLILVWLLKRVFYRPVLAVIEKRRAETAAVIANAEEKQREAEVLKGEYAARLAGADEARAAAKSQLDEEMAAERAKRLDALKAELDAERKRRESLAERERRELEQTLERQATVIASRFAARLLDRLSGPELENKLVDLALSELEIASADKREAMQAALREPNVRLQLTSAYPLDGARREAFTQVLAKLAGRAVEPEFGEDATLKAGVCIVAGAWVLMANLRDELKYFAGSPEHGG